MHVCLFFLLLLFSLLMLPAFYPSNYGLELLQNPGFDSGDEGSWLLQGSYFDDDAAASACGAYSIVVRRFVSTAQYLTVFTDATKYESISKCDYY